MSIRLSLQIDQQLYAMVTREFEIENKQFICTRFHLNMELKTQLLVEIIRMFKA